MAEQITIEHLRAVMDFVSQNAAITNREFRGSIGLGYDSAIKIFGAMCMARLLKKSGEGVNTKYVALQTSEGAGKQIRLEHLATLMDFLTKNGNITNPQCQILTGLSADDSMRAFDVLRKVSMLRKTPASATDTYELISRRVDSPSHEGSHRKTVI